MSNNSVRCIPLKGIEMKKSLIAIVASGFIASGSAYGVTFGDGGAALQNVIDGITVSTTSCTGTLPGDCPSSVDVNADQVAPDEYWSIGGAGGSLNTIVIELAAFAGTNKFGIYDKKNISKTVQLFDGSKGAGDQSLVSIKADGSVYVNFSDTLIDFAGNTFGYYLDSTVGGGGFWYSDLSLNSDGTDHLAAYQGGAGDTIKYGGLSAGKWLDSEYLLAWEDLNCSTYCDADYTDFVVMVESVTSVPEPTTLALLGLGLLGFGIRAQRKC